MQHHIALMATVSLQNITPREALDSPTKPTFPSLCRGAARVSHPTKHSQEQKEKGQRWVWKQGYSTGTKFFQSLEPKPGEEINHGHTDKGPTLISDQLSLGHQGGRDRGKGEKDEKMSFVFSNQLKKIHFASIYNTSLRPESVSFSYFNF